MKKHICLIIFSLPLMVFAQKLELLSSGTKTSIRGLSVVDDRVAWVSGSNGMLAKTTDSGKTWNWSQVKGFEKTDFRDIEAFDDAKAIIMGVDSPGFILKTIDGGASWKVVYRNDTKGFFLDAMEFWNDDSGIAIGDPIDHKFFILRTFNGGNDWQEIPYANRPTVDSGEACFAASGTNIRKLKTNEAIFVSGGLRSRLFIRDNQIDLPLIQGRQTTGANSVAVFAKRDKVKKIFVAGGDFAKESSSEKNCFYSVDMGKTWVAPEISPKGYKSCIEFISEKKLIACGTSGVDISEDGGLHWKYIDKTGFHVCRKAKNGKAVFLAGGNGRIAKLTW